MAIFGYVLRVELLSNIVFRLTKNKHIGSHDELIYSYPRAGVDTGTLECDVIMDEYYSTATINKIICTQMLHGLISDWIWRHINSSIDK